MKTIKITGEDRAFMMTIREAIDQQISRKEETLKVLKDQIRNKKWTVNYMGDFLHGEMSIDVLFTTPDGEQELIFKGFYYVEDNGVNLFAEDNSNDSMVSVMEDLIAERQITINFKNNR
jgi:hypothetical protein